MLGNRRELGLVINRTTVRSALKLWRQLDKMDKHQLAGLTIVRLRCKAMSEPRPDYCEGIALRTVLGDALERLRLDSGEPNYSAEEWYPYLILKEQYIQGRKRDYILQQLEHVSTNRTFHRVQNRGLELLADVLRRWEKEAYQPSPLTEEKQVLFLAPPRPAYRIVGRYTLLQTLKGQLFADNSVDTHALNGLPGVGKTALAIELAHDSEVLAHFKGGVLWAGLGRKPDVLSLLGRWALALGFPAEQLAKITGKRQRAEIVHMMIGVRQMLLILDDVWQLEAALALKLGGPNCAYLLTTRFVEIAQDFAGKGAIPVSELSKASGFLLLEQIAPNIVTMIPEESMALVQTAGGLPLTLIVIGRYLRHLDTTEPEMLQETVGQLRRVVDHRLHLQMPQGLVDSHPSLPTEVPFSLLKAIQISVKSLDDSARRALYDLAAFLPKPNTFSREAAIAVSNALPADLDKLINYSLVEIKHPDRLMVHQAIADYVSQKPIAQSTLERMVTFYVRFIEMHQADFKTLDREWDNLFVALQTAVKYRMWVELIRGVNDLYDFLEIRGFLAEAQEYLLVAEKAVRKLADTAGLVTTLLSLGRLAVRQQDNGQAERYLHEGLKLARVLKQRDKISRFLQNLGYIARVRGDLDEAEAYYQEAILLAKELKQARQISTLLMDLGILAGIQGRYDETERFLQEGLEFARQSGDDRVTSAILGNLGVLAEKRGRYEEAERVLRQGLELANGLGYRERIVDMLANLGAVVDLCGRYDEAEIYNLEALELAEELGLMGHQALLQLNLGILALKRGNHKQARTYFTESLAKARTHDYLEVVIVTLRYLGALSTKQSLYDQAEQYLSEALSLSQEGNYGEVPAVLLEWGQLHLQTGNYTAARDVFNEAMEVAEELGAQAHTGRALFGLAQVARALNDLSKARHKGKESLRILDAVGHEEANIVKKWLEELSS